MSDTEDSTVSSETPSVHRAISTRGPMGALKLRKNRNSKKHGRGSVTWSLHNRASRIYHNAPKRVLQSLSNTLAQMRIFNTKPHKHTEDCPALPPIFCDSIVYLRQNGLQQEGIFRIPGDHEVVQQLKERFENGDAMFLDELECDVHDVATLLKQHITEHPLIPEPYYKRMISMWTKSDGLSDNEKAKIMADATLKLPLGLRVRLAFLLQFLYIVAHLSSINLMTTEALSVIFAPVVFVSPENTPLEQMLEENKIAIEVSRLLIENADLVQIPENVQHDDHEHHQSHHTFIKHQQSSLDVAKNENEDYGNYSDASTD